MSLQFGIHLKDQNVKSCQTLCVSTNKMHKILVIRLYFQYTLYMFRTVSVHLQEQVFFLVYADTIRLALVLLATGVYQIGHAAYKKPAPEDELIQSGT